MRCCDGKIRFGSDSYYIPNFLSTQTSTDCYFSLIDNEEVEWYLHYFNNNGSLHPVERLTSTQYRSNDDNVIPWYRYPINNQQKHHQMPFTNSIQKLSFLVEQEICQPINHSVINLYRDGNDYIPFHRDNTLDIKHGSSIATINLGASRQYTVKSDEDGTSKTIILEHGSLLVLGPETNQKWQHSIVKDSTIKSPRISVTMRYISTFLNRNNQWIMGQGELYQDINYPLSPFNDHILNHQPDKISFHYHGDHGIEDGVHSRNSVISVIYQRDTIHSVITKRDSHFHGMLFRIKTVNEGMEYMKRVWERYPKKGHAPFALVFDGSIISGDDQEWDLVNIGNALVNLLTESDMDRVLLVVVRHWMGTFLGLSKLKAAYVACAESVIHGMPRGGCRVYRYDDEGKDVTSRNLSQAKL